MAHEMNVVLIAGLVVFLAYKQVQATLDRDVLTYINGFRHLHAAGPLLVDDIIQKNAKSAAAVFAKTKNKNSVPLFKYSANFCTFTGAERDLSRKCVVSWYVSMKYYSWCEPKAKGPALPFVNLIWKASTKAGVGITKDKTGAYYVVLYIGLQDSDDVVRNVPPVKVVMEASPKAECPIGYSRLDTSCFRYQNIPVTWDEAVYRCALENATLASIRNAKEEEFVRNLQQRVGIGSQTWIGLHDSLHEGRFKWFDGLKFHKDVCVPVTANGGISENCVAWSVSNPKGCWEDRRCDEKIPFTCRIPVEGKSTYRTEILFKKFRWRANYKNKSSKAYRDLVNGVKVTFKELFTRMSGKKKGGFRKVKVKSVRPVSFQGRPAGLGITLSLKFRSFTPDPTVRFQKFLRDSEKIMSMAIDKPDKVEGKTGRAGNYCYNACNQSQGSCKVQAPLPQGTMCLPYCFTANPMVTSTCPPSCPPACCSTSIQQPPPYNYYPGSPAVAPSVPYPSYPWGTESAYSYDSYPQTCPAACSQYPTLDCFMHCNDECCINRAGGRRWSPKAAEIVKKMRQNFQKLKQLVARERNKPKIVPPNMKGKDLEYTHSDDEVRTADAIKAMKNYLHNLESVLQREHESKVKKVDNMKISAQQTARSNSSLSNKTIANRTDDDEGQELRNDSLIDNIKGTGEQEGQDSIIHENPSNKSESDNESDNIDNTDEKLQSKADYEVADGRRSDSRARNMAPSGSASHGSKGKDGSTPHRSKEDHEGARVGNKSLPGDSGGNGGQVERQKTNETTAMQDGERSKNQTTMESKFPVENSSWDEGRNGHHKADFSDDQEEDEEMKSNDISEVHDPVMNETEDDFLNDEVSNDSTKTQGTDQDESGISLDEEDTSVARDRNSSFAADIDTSDEEYERKKANRIPEPLGTGESGLRRNDSISGDKVAAGGEGERGNNTSNGSVVEDFHDTSHTNGKVNYTMDIGGLDEYRNDINNKTWTQDNVMNGNKVSPSLNEEAKHMTSEFALNTKNHKIHDEVSKNGVPDTESNDRRHEEYLKEVSNQTWIEGQPIDANKDSPVKKDGAKYKPSESAVHVKNGTTDKEMNRNIAPDTDSNDLKHEDYRTELSNETWTEGKPMDDNNDDPLLNDGAKHVPSESAFHFKNGTTLQEINTIVKGAPDSDNDHTHAETSGTLPSKETSLNLIGSGGTLNDDVGTQINQVTKGSSPEIEKEILDDGSNTNDTAEKNKVGTSKVVNSTLGAGEADNSLIDFHGLQDETTDELLDQEGIGDTGESGKKRNKVAVAKKSKH